MSKSQPLDPQEKVVEVLKSVDEDINNFDQLMDTWNSVFALGAPKGASNFADVETAAISSVAAMNEVLPSSGIGRRAGILLDQFSSPAFLVRESGVILAQNTKALEDFSIKEEGNLRDLPFYLEQDEQIVEVVRASLDPRRNLHDAVLKRAYSTDNEHTVTLSIAPSKPIDGGVGEALVFVVEARWKTKVCGLIKREFNLTKAEQALLEGFLDGKSTQEMAILRGRSHATIRTQFYSLMTKMGAQNQTELFRNALSISEFVDKVGAIADVLRHPHRKRVDLVRPRGRSVEVTMAGDLGGIPIVFLQSVVGYTFDKKTEKAFYDAGLCVLSMCRAGYGDTDPNPECTDYFEVFDGDLRALLDQLGHEKCFMFATNTSSSFMYPASRRLSDRVKGLIQLGAAPPICYFEDGFNSVPWAKGIITASEKHPALKEFMTKAGLKAWRAMGQKRFFKIQFRNSDFELRHLLQPDPLEEFDNALRVATKQGYDAAIHDTMLAFSDFSSDVAATDLPILVIHGEKDLVFSTDALRAFVNDYAERMTYIVTVGAGVSILISHLNEVVEHIVDFCRAQD